MRGEGKGEGRSPPPAGLRLSRTEYFFAFVVERQIRMAIALAFPSAARAGTLNQKSQFII
jgi:hypothetical protein